MNTKTARYLEIDSVTTKTLKIVTKQNIFVNRSTYLRSLKILINCLQTVKI